MTDSTGSRRGDTDEVAGGADGNGFAPDSERESRRWRAIWRIHFYAGLFAAPILLLLALTGLVILYTQPIQDWLEGDVRTVDVGDERLSYDEQAAAVGREYPDATIVSLVTPPDAHHATRFGIDDGRDVFVDPYTGEVLGTRDPAGGIVGLANRLHGTLNNESLKVKLPTAAGLFGPDPLFAEFAIGDVVVEIFACWGLVLAATGIYLWWPRKRGTGKALFVPRLSKRGRARWRDLHAVPGFLLSWVLVFFVVSGLPWSGYWGGNFDFLAEKATPGSYPDPPTSSVARLGDVDRFGNRINWVLQDLRVPASPAPAEARPAAFGADDDHGSGHGGGGAGDAGDGPARLSLDRVVRAAREEGLKDGFGLSFPEDVTADDGTVTYGSFAAANPWPGRSQDALTVYFDQFTGATLGRQELYGFGTVWRAADYTISTHMGTQFGLVNRIVMTFGCLALIWAVISAAVMYWKRRRPGSLGLPRRPVDLRIANHLVVIAVVLALIYPLWGVTALVVLAIDRYVIRRVPRLRQAFGQR